jgi:hypothetical protein
MNITSESLLNRYKEFKQKSDNLKTSNPAMSNTYKKMSDRYYNMYTTQLNNERINSVNTQSDEDILDELDSLDQLERTLTNNNVPPTPPPSIIQPQSLISVQTPVQITTPTAPIRSVNRPLGTPPPPPPRPPSVIQPQTLNSIQMPTQITTPTAPIRSVNRPLGTPPPPPPPPPRNSSVSTNLPIPQSQNVITSLPPPRPTRVNVSPTVTPPTPARSNVSPSPASFRSTLKKRQSTALPIRANANTCKSVLTFGKRTNLKYYIPSQFPNITRAKYYTQQGGKKTRRRK